MLFLTTPTVFSKNYNHFEMRDEWQLRTDDGVNLFVRQFGIGDTVIVLHGGWGSEHSNLIDAFINIADKYHFVFYDQRGSLRSPCADSLISVPKHIEDVEQLRKELGLEKVIIAGYSMGTFLGMSYLEKYPENVKGLVMIAAIPAKATIFGLMPFMNAAIKRWERQDVLDTLKAHGLDGDRKNFTAKQRGTWHRITQSAINMHSVKNWRQGNSFYYQEMAGRAAASTMPMAIDFTEIIKKTNIPITVIHGDDDYLPLFLHEEWTSTIPNVELKVIENAGHLPWYDQPEIFKTAILSALEKYKK